MATKQKEEKEIEVLKVTQNTLTFHILGITPLVMNAMSAKVKQGLLLPKKKNAAELASTLKHDPVAEYQTSIYRCLNDDGPTRIIFPSVGYKKALASTALDIPGNAAKSQIGRLTYVNQDYVPIYGIPKIWMTVVRSAGMNHTPDVRSRAIIPEWASLLKLTFVTPILRDTAVINLLAAAGLMRGIGDGRPEKGWGSYGQFEIVGKEDERWMGIVNAGGRIAQDVALDDPHPYDSETAELLKWFNAESKRRGFKVA